MYHLRPRRRNYLETVVLFEQIVQTHLPHHWYEPFEWWMTLRINMCETHLPKQYTKHLIEINFKSFKWCNVITKLISFTFFQIWTFCMIYICDIITISIFKAFELNLELDCLVHLESSRRPVYVLEVLVSFAFRCNPFEHKKKYYLLFDGSSKYW